MGKITRGLDNDFIQAFKKSELFDFFKQNENELILGVRNNYINLYYNCDSIARIHYKKRKKIFDCEIDRFYLEGISYKGKEKKYLIDPNELKSKFETIKENSNSKSKNEKKAQSKLVIINNQNPNSNWYCIDVEYIKQYNNKKEKSDMNFNGRFDIIAISKSTPHRIAIIELKYGKNAIGGESGVYKHIQDFYKFLDLKIYENHFKYEVLEIVKSLKELEINIPFSTPNINSFPSKPEFYFITLNNFKNGNNPKNTMAGYLFKDIKWGCNRLSKKNCVEVDFGDVTKKKNKINASFLFSEETFPNIKINDIIDGNYDEKLLPTD